MWTWLFCLIGAYLIGSIPFGFILGRMRGVDIRQAGSGNIGATNVGRVLGRPLGMFCFALDVLKGVGPVIASGTLLGLLGEDLLSVSAGWVVLWMTVAVATVLGHMFSIYLGFAGGKGVATGFGAMAAMWPWLTWPAIAALVIWCMVMLACRFVSIASMLAALSLPILSVVYWLWVEPQPDDTVSSVERLSSGWPLLVGSGAIALLVVLRHRDNIARLLKGLEPKQGQPDKEPKS